MGKQKNIVKKIPALDKVSPKKKFWYSATFFFAAILTLGSLIDYDPGNLHTYPPSGDIPIFGRVGLHTSRLLLCIFGISAWLLPLIFFQSSFLFWKKSNAKIISFKVFSILLTGFGLSLLGSVRESYLAVNGLDPMFSRNSHENGAGGIIGSWFYSGLKPEDILSLSNGGFFRLWFGEIGSSIIGSLFILTGLYLIISWNGSKQKLLSSLLTSINRLCSFLIRIFSSILARNQSSAHEKPVSKGKAETPQENEPISVSSLNDKKSDDLLFGDVSLEQNSFNEKSSKKKSPSKVSSDSSSKKSVNQESSEESPLTNDPPVETEQYPKDEVLTSSESDVSDVAMEGFKVVRAEKTEKATDLFPERKGDYHFPTLDLLMEPPEVNSGGDEDHMIKAKRLKETLSEFKIDVELGEVHTGPVITRYDIHPAAGVRVEKIANLDKNLAMALRAESVRILAPVPGKGCVGVEVPNDLAAPVCLKEILQSKAWADANAEIPIVLGKEASGKPLVADLTKMPHLLVAGSTGSGKTVCINAIIASLCYHSSPEDVRFIMVDPKIVEMKVYNDLPHMLIPVVTEPKKVPGALKWLLVEMERRYQIFSKVGVRNIAGFNAKILKDKEEKEKAQLLDAEMTAEERAALSSIEVPRDDDALEIPENKLPYIVCIIDELADLMMVAQADVETGIARLAQLARAAGIHLIIATQRPSVNVITGVIKANLPSRISFRVASYRDSQTILDGKGAESLIGKGDMLFIPPGSATFMRAQGAFVSDDEINGIVDYLKVNGPPQIIEEVREQIESAGEEDVLGSSGENEDEDPMLKKAVEIIRTTKRASTSNLQRKLSIGYNRAARIMDELEDRGVVGPDVPGQGREILIDV
jgi:S-DNA-T family DNA segregation ATPase FtsK/SpoIIIE